MDKKLRTKDKILQASIELFNQQGERAVTTNHIAAHLGISPGNLYYHFRNKEDIIRHIFKEYAKLLDSRVLPPKKDVEILDSLTEYMDVVFELVWRFRFFYANLPDILSRDAALQQDYLNVQKVVQNRVVMVLQALNTSQVIAIDEGDISGLAHTIKMTVSFWVSYLETQCPGLPLGKPHAYWGVIKVLLLVKPFATPASQPSFERLQQHYHQLAGASPL